MKVTLLQTDIHWARPEENIQKAARLIADNSGSDLYVLPEMWSTGFATEPEGIAAVESDNPALRWMCQEAAERQCAICGSLAVSLSDHTFRNRLYFVDGKTGHVSYYDKHHLFTYGHEHLHYTAGSQQMVVSYGRMRFLLLVCYDLRFPCWSRYADSCEYDAIIIVANWPESRQSAWQILTRARAIENQCYLIGVNRVGQDHYNHYAGASVVVDAIGRTIGQCHRYLAEAVTVEIDLQELQRRRNKFQVLDDRDQ